MKSHLLLLLFCCALQSATGQVLQDSAKVTFMLHAPTLPSGTTVYLTGSTKKLGNWHPGTIKLDYAGEQALFKQLYLQEKTIEYKFTLGSWLNQPSDAQGRPLPNFILHLQGDTAVHHQLEHWLVQDSAALASGITGTVVYHRNLTADSLQPRNLVVWLPPGYEKGKKRYPVLYMHDGQNIFDPATSAFGVDWRIDETADSLMRKGIIEPAIIVGIYNTTDRMEEYIPGHLGRYYMDFVVHQVKPLIDRTYRTKPGPKHTLTGGSSAGGIIAFMLAWEYPQVFSKAICMSPAFKIAHIDYVKEVQAYTGKKKPLRFYIDNGGIDLEARLQPGIDQMLEALQQKGYREGRDYVWFPDQQAQHNEAAWAKRMPGALRFMLGK